MATIVKHKIQRVIKTLFLIALGLISLQSFGQGDPTDSFPDDPGGITVFPVQNISFGAFSNGITGGTVIISPNGTRSVTGNVIPLNLGTQYFQAIFDISAPLGSIVSILNGSNATLTGSNGGSMIMSIGGSYPGSPFIITIPQPTRTPVSIGGTLTVGSNAANPPGIYSGTFYITLNLE